MEHRIESSQHIVLLKFGTMVQYTS